MAPTWRQLRTLVDAGEDIHAGRSWFEPSRGSCSWPGRGPCSPTRTSICVT